MMNLEDWVIHLLADIQDAAVKGECYDLHLDHAAVEEIAVAYQHTEWIEFY